MPTWALALVVGASLVGSAWLFLADRSDDSAQDAASTSTKEDRAESVLSLPKGGDEPTDERRRGAEGRKRLDADPTTTTNADGDATTDTGLPPSFASLKGRRVALAAASSEGNGDVARLMRIGSLRVPCATPGSTVGTELAIATAMSELLSRAGATTVGNDDDAFSRTQCVDRRVRAFGDADAAVVVRVVDGTVPRVLVGRPSGTPDGDSISLAAEMAAALDLPAVTPARSAELRSLLANSGAIDAADGAAVVLIELPETSISDDGSRRSLVEDLVGAIAAFVARADQRPDASAPRRPAH